MAQDSTQPKTKENLVINKSNILSQKPWLPRLQDLKEPLLIAQSSRRQICKAQEI